MTRFEDRHRELRDGADFETEHEFNVRTGSLVDDLVAAVRERQTVDASVVIQGYEAAEYLRLDLAVNAALAALDEASDG